MSDKDDMTPITKSGRPLTRTEDRIRRFLRERRRSLDVHQQQLANRLGISQAYLSMIERGRVPPSLRTAEAIAAELGVTPKELYTRCCAD